MAHQSFRCSATDFSSQPATVATASIARRAAQSDL
ncbi:hypothetical protein SNOG_04665 [Parastagonospora nodorum SN15]|uniref:Uncharacterized protein n=1 Tax=Phaeosphaeria nodorum (strain SN15 / ATCC MYA-4574 / FGSC 10173) TaxID=321614 RepID=Q0UU99_PHANO|nr:hypothetical protein SNOG_04665 [Parastagonospora nodorum SN15]EAT88425.1 hypothetical protein SNOG_04665 [Parastagonospora nodorum SN15]